MCKIKNLKQCNCECKLLSVRKHSIYQQTVMENIGYGAHGIQVEQTLSFEIFLVLQQR